MSVDVDPPDDEEVEEDELPVEVLVLVPVPEPEVEVPPPVRVLHPSTTAVLYVAASEAFITPVVTMQDMQLFLQMIR